MCFCLYLATSSEPPLIPDQGYQQGSGKINTSRWRLDQLKKGEGVRNKFTLPCVTGIGSDVGCGCGFRYGEVDDFSPDEISKTQPNQQGLVGYLAEHCGKEHFVELYGCWAGDELQEVRDRREIELAELADKQFYFCMNGYCRVRMPGAGNDSPSR